MRPLLHKWRPKPQHRVRLFTNGLLLQKQLEHNPIINNITQFFISIDAGSAAVYEQVRQPGKFHNLIENLNFLKSVVDTTGALVLLKFVLQKDNHADMQNFVDLCNRYQFNGVINRLENWGTWADFDSQDVIGNPNHPLHKSAVDNLKDVYRRHDRKIIFNPSLITIAQQ